MAFTVHIADHSPEGEATEQIAIGADDYRFNEVGEYAMFVEFYTNDTVEEVIDAGRVIRIERT